MAESRLRDLFAALRQYSEERKKPRTCPVCARDVVQVGQGREGLYACRNVSCGWQGTTPDRAY